MIELLDIVRETSLLLEVVVAQALRSVPASVPGGPSVGLTGEQWNALRVIGGQTVRMGELAQRILCDDSKTTRIVDGLADAGLVRRDEDPGDRRARRVSITARGKTELDAATKRCARVLAGLISDAAASRATDALADVREAIRDGEARGE